MLSIVKSVSAYELKDEVWSGGLETLLLIMEQDKLQDLMDLLAELYPEPVDITTINDLLWFEEYFLLERLDINHTSRKEL
jgi:hypothetical protein